MWPPVCAFKAKNLPDKIYSQSCYFLFHFS